MTRRPEPRSARGAALVILIGCLAVSPAARGKESDAARAARYFKSATESFKQRKFVQALALFRKAYGLRPHYLVQCSIARCHEIVGNVVEAARSYERCRDEGAARAGLASSIEASLAGVRAQITWLQVTSATPGATLSLDGKEVGPLPQKIAVNPGRHELEVRAPDAAPARESVQTMGGETLSLALSPAARAEASPRVPVGAADRERAPRAEKPASRRLAPPWFWASVAATALMGITTAVLGGLTVRAQSAFNDDPSVEALDRFTQRRLLTNIFLGLTLASAAGTTTLYFLTDFKAGQAKERRVATFGVGLQGAF